MHILALPDKTQLEYLLYVFHKHVTGGLEPEELDIAGRVWANLKNVKELDPAALTPNLDEPDEPEVVKIKGPLNLVHNGDLHV